MRSHWGWGYEDRQPSPDERRAAAVGLARHLGFGSAPEEPVALEAVRLPDPRVRVPAALRELCSQDHGDRVRHAHGRSYLDVVRGLRGRFPHPPDAVARPGDEAQLALVLEWCADERLAVIPYGGGTSVVGGVDAIPGPRHNGAVSVDLGRLDRVLEVDSVSRAARIQAGASGPALERQLGDLTLRFYPQSFELSTLGGWVATRAAGHFATGPTHIDDLVESIRALTVNGEVWESRRLPASGAGPSPDRMLLGSEGTLALIVDAWVRVRPRPDERAGASVRFKEFAAGCAAVHDVVQDGLAPANCRLLGAREAALTAAGDSDLLVLGFEGALARERLVRAIAHCERHGGAAEERSSSGERWREAFLRAPYLRDTLVAMGVVSETFESAITWDRLDGFVRPVTTATREALGEGIVTCRLTHAYPDGAAPYFTVLAPARRGDEEEAWTKVKRAAAEAVLAAGGTITHHHAVGRDHRPFYERQRPEPFARALRAAKSELDPLGLLNPGVLLHSGT